MRVMIFILLSFLSLQVLAQHKQFELPVGWQGNRIELQTISDKNKQHSCLLIVNSDSLRGFLCNNQLRIVREFSLPVKPGEKLLGGMLRDSSVYVFLQQKDKDELHSWAFNVMTKRITERVFPFDIKKEKAVTYISGGNHFLYITADNRTTELTVYDFTSERDFTSVRHNFSEKQWNDLITGGIFNHTVKLEKIDQEGDCDLDAVVKPNKIYIRNDTLLLLMNNHIDSTHVCCFDLKQHVVSSWVIDHNPGQPSAKKVSYSDNSFLFRNKLYYVRATTDSLLIQVVDLYTRAIDKSFSTGGDEPIPFKNTPIFQEGSRSSKSELRDVGKRQLLRKMVNGAAVITAKPYDNNQIEVVVGSYAKVYGGNKDNNPAYMASPNYVGGPMLFPVRNVSRESWSKSVHFKMLLNAGNYSHMEGDIGSSINERIERYTGNLKIPAESESLFMNNGTYYYAYYDLEVRKLVVIKF
ncbi:hypothetical protein A3860_32220 [Niastella vici]|uniref:6-bladed beta-propeller n=1 Tax=Niastella vici TaxID=1703345 RepID=A0A1V9FQK5_9BACT|nr:hypothetical protein [Niastella vici]OQP60669.1 hypothetical protein A3860_32220 [Niastella vici]